MLNFFVTLQTFMAARRRDEETGASAVEYGLLVALIAAVIVGAVLLFGNFIGSIFTDTCTAINGAACE